MSMLTSGQYFCTSCGIQNVTTIDVSAGSKQIYVEDCDHCCRSNVLHVTVGDNADDIQIQAEAEA